MKNIDRAPKVEEVFGIDGHFSAAENLDRTPLLLVIETGGSIDGVIGCAKGIGPEVGSDGTGPSTGSMDELGSGLFLEEANAPHLCTPILVVGINPCERKTLAFVGTCSLPLVGIEDAIVSMVVGDLHPMGDTVGLESTFCFHSFQRGCCLL